MKRAELPDAGSWLWTCALASVSLALASASGTVHAHAGPQVRGIFWGSEQAPKMLLSNRGLIFAHSNGSDWRLMCNEALGVGTSELPSIVQMPDGRIVAASTVGLSESSDSGCTR